MNPHLLSSVNSAVVSDVSVCELFTRRNNWQISSVRNRDVRFGTKLGQLAPNMTNSGLFKDQISVHFGSPSQNERKFDLKKLRFVSFGVNLIHLGPT